MDWPTPTSARIQLSSFLDKLQCAVLPDEKRLAMTENDVQARLLEVPKEGTVGSLLPEVIDRPNG